MSPTPRSRPARWRCLARSGEEVRACPWAADGARATIRPSCAAAPTSPAPATSAFSRAPGRGGISPGRRRIEALAGRRRWPPRRPGPPAFRRPRGPEDGAGRPAGAGPRAVRGRREGCRRAEGRSEAPGAPAAAETAPRRPRRATSPGGGRPPDGAAGTWPAGRGRNPLADELPAPSRPRGGGPGAVTAGTGRDVVGVTEDPRWRSSGRGFAAGPPRPFRRLGGRGGGGLPGLGPPTGPCRRRPPRWLAHPWAPWPRWQPVGRADPPPCCGRRHRLAGSGATRAAAPPGAGTRGKAAPRANRAEAALGALHGRPASWADRLTPSCHRLPPMGGSPLTTSYLAADLAGRLLPGARQSRLGGRP